MAKGWSSLFPELGNRTLVLGVLNVTPDSFSDGGRFAALETALARAVALKDAGADIIDVGGESTRPGAKEVGEQTELARVIPVVDGIVRAGLGPVSIDTRKASVAQRALESGARIVNDVSGFAFDPRMRDVVKEHGAAAIVMHARADPETMQLGTWHYQGGVVTSVLRDLARTVRRAEEAGISREAMAVDPGIGFGKTTEENLELLSGLRRFSHLGCPVAIGTSRKSFLGRLTGKEAEDRVFATAATIAWAIAEGVSIVRVHDVSEMKDVVTVADAIGAARTRI